MATAKTYRILSIGVAGTTTTFPVTDAVDVYNIKATGGTVVLAGNVSLASSGTPVAGSTTYSLLISGGFTLGANTFTVFGQTLTAAQCLYKQRILAYFNDSSAWEVYIASDDSDATDDVNGADIVSGTITNTQIASAAAIAWTKLASSSGSTRGHFLRSGPNGVVESAVGSVAGNMLIGDGTDVVSVTPSGAFTLSGAGVATIPAGYVTTAMLASPGSTLLEASLTIATAAVLTLNGTPVTIIAAPGAGKYIEIISASASMTFVSAAYATNTTLRLRCNGATIGQLQDTAILLSSVSKNTRFKDVTSAAAGETQIITNTAVVVDVATGNPTTGDSTLVIKCCYRIVTI